MIPEYKLYHGAVLADIVDRCDGSVSIRECIDPGRLLNYVLDERIGVQIKYSTARLRPWTFSFPSNHIRQLQRLHESFPQTFVVLICSVDGLATIPGKTVLDALKGCKSGGWLRATRKKREMYQVFGPEGEIPGRFRTTTDPIAEALLIDSRPSDEDLNERDAVDVYSSAGICVTETLVAIGDIE